MTYPDSVKFLYSLGNETKAVKFGLEGIRILLRALDNPHERLRFVHVAGTNGKGSTCAMVAAALRASGVRTGLFTSPHLSEPVERIRIDGVPVTAEVFSTAFDVVHRAAERLLRDGLLETHPTYFEMVTAMAFLLFRDAGVEWVALEVGLGGRLDATNVVTPQIAVITPVDFDHEAYLGKSIEAIASEKAGILKPGVPAVFARQRAEAEAELTRRAVELGIPVVHTAEWPALDLEIDARGSRFHTHGYEIRCPLAGEHQVDNAITAVAALHTLGVEARAIERGIAATVWPARLELFNGRPDILIDGAHNPAGTRALAVHLQRFYADRKITLLYGAMRDKAIEESAGILFPLAAEIILTAPDQPRAVRPEALAELASHPRLRIAPRFRDALPLLEGADLVVIAGSLFLAGEARAYLVK